MTKTNVQIKPLLNTLVARWVESDVKHGVTSLDGLREIARQPYTIEQIRDHFASHYEKFYHAEDASSMASQRKNLITLLRDYNVPKGTGINEAVRMTREMGVTKNKKGNRGRPTALKALTKKLGKKKVDAAKSEWTAFVKRHGKELAAAIAKV